jgi:uncharacterized membrane protein YdbT with pleckstrin-like domain
MAITQADAVNLIKNMHLFRKLGAQAVETAAALFEPVEVSKAELLFREGDPASNFYIVYSGRVTLTRSAGKKAHAVISLVPGDYFGLESIEKNQRQLTTATAAEHTVLLRLDKSKLAILLHKIPTLIPYLRVALSSRKLYEHTTLNWLNPGEVVYLMSRKSQVFLWTALVLPVCLLLASMVLFVVVFSGQMGLLPVVGAGLLGFAAVLWGIWNAIDWGNDYYLVTNERAVWLEKIVGIYDSREEAPLSTLLSVSVDTELFGRWYGYGDVVLRTYTGTIIFRRIDHPEQVAPIIEEHWFRARAASKEEENLKMEQSLRQRLGLTPQEGAKAEPAEAAQPVSKPVAVVVKPGFLQRLFANFYRLRFEEGGVVTYRKHWFILLVKTFWPMVWILVGIAIAVARLMGYLDLFSVKATLLVDGVYLFGILLWYLYRYVDWRNDIYQLTPDQVVDIYRKPLGREDKRSAPLENILSIEYSRRDILALILNFGTVVIKVGTARLDFKDVYAPSQVQQEIFKRMQERIERKKQQEADAERERVSEWLVAYHHMQEENSKGENPPKPSGFQSKIP